jgi:repressor LexA
MDFTKALAYLINEKGMKQFIIADKLDVTQATVSRWLTGKQIPDYVKGKAIERLVGLTQIIDFDKMPILGGVGAGGLVSFENINETVPRPAAMPEMSFALIMREAGGWLDEGDLLLCYPQQTDQAKIAGFIGQKVAVKTVDGKMYVKRLRRGYEPNTFNLEGINAALIESATLVWVAKIDGSKFK